MPDLRHKLTIIAKEDVDQLVEKDAAYGSSWKRRGGQGAFFQGIARKWDRIENIAKAHNYDLFAAVKENPGKEGVLDDIGDLRRYCALIEAEMREWPNNTGEANPRGYVDHPDEHAGDPA